MAGKIGNKNAAKPAGEKTRVRQITLREHERGFFVKLADGEGLTHGIRRAYEMLGDEKLLIAAADASGAARTLTGVETDGTRTSLVARKGLQLAVRNGEIVVVYLWRLKDEPFDAGGGWCPIDDPERASLDIENYSLFRDIEPAS